METGQALVIGAGPAGLMAADVLSSAGAQVIVTEAKPSVGRKFLMAGKSGLNLTKDEPLVQTLAAYGWAEPHLHPMITPFGPNDVQAWARDLGQDLFTGTTGRVFPVAMKASPLLRAWLARLAERGATLRTRWRWLGWEGHAARFDTPDGERTLSANVTVLALGGASWARLGSDGAWAETLSSTGMDVTPFAPANAGLSVSWSAPMQKHFGKALKAVALHAGSQISRGEITVSAKGLEGGGLYSLTPELRGGGDLTLDLKPDWTVDQVSDRLSAPRGKASMANHLRKRLNLGPVSLALLQEFARPLPSDPYRLAALVKGLTIRHQGVRPMDEAISTAGGVAWTSLTEGLELRAKPGVYCAGEMLDWEAPTGGYLLTACFATGRWAGLHAAEKLGVSVKDTLRS